MMWSTFLSGCWQDATRQSFAKVVSNTLVWLLAGCYPSELYKSCVEHPCVVLDRMLPVRALQKLCSTPLYDCWQGAPHQSIAEANRQDRPSPQKRRPASCKCLTMAVDAFLSVFFPTRNGDFLSVLLASAVSML